MAVVYTVLGVGFIAAALIDSFQTLFHPAGRGALSDWAAKLTWRIFRRAAKLNPRILTYAGSVAILLIIVSWVAFTWFGFALLYLPRLGSGFDFSQARDASPHSGIAEAMSLSVGALITMSEGSYAKLHWLQLVRGAEAVVGFGLLTASMSWLLSIYPVLETRRALAQSTTLLHNAERENRLDFLNAAPDQAKEWILTTGTELTVLRNQMAQFPITYYFDIGEPETALAGSLSYLYELSFRASAHGSPGMKIAGTILGGAVESFLDMLAEDFLSVSNKDKQAILRAYAAEQMSDLMLQRRTIPYPRKKAS